MRVVFMGTPEFAIPTLERLSLSHHEVLAVYTRPDKPVGRGQSVVYSPVKKTAMDKELKIVQPVTLKSPEAVADLASLKPDVIVVAAYGQILPKTVLDIPARGCLNIHPSLLPRFRGASPIPAAILAGDMFTGVSIMLMDEGLDTGPVLSRAAISMSNNDTTGSLTTKLSLLAARLLDETMVHWSRGEIFLQPQNEAGASYSKVITKEDGEISWSLQAVEIWRRVRAFNPWPGGYTRWRGKHLKILRSMPLDGGQGLEPGRVISLDRPGLAFGVVTASGVLGIAEVQLEGKRAMSSAEFLRGQRSLVGATLPNWS